ncbi:MAG: ABC transporter ATP-binding protein [Anaerolineales bacterium]|nr:ABC transporter ATP-binding protein [Anaerolineales bacterium]
MAIDQWEEEEFDESWDTGTLRRMLELAARHKAWLWGFVGTVALVALSDSYFNYLKKLVIDEAIIPGEPRALIRIGGLFLLLSLAQAAMVFTFIYLAGLLGERIQYDLRRSMFAKLQELSFSYFDRTPVGWIMSRVTSDPSKVADLVTWGLLDSTWAVMSIVSSVGFMLYLKWDLGILVFLTIPVLVMAGALFKQRIIRQFRKVRRVNSKITAAFNETITGVRVIKALGREQRNLREFRVRTDEMYAAGFRAAWLSALFLPVVQGIGALALAAVAWFGGAQVLGGTVSIGTIQAFIGYVTFMLWPVQDLARVFSEMQHAIASAERSFSLVDSRPEIVDRPGAVAAESLRGAVEFDRVSFWYKEGEPVLEDFSLRVGENTSIALVGPTGGGKTTIASLLCRFYEPRRGVIRIAGRDYTTLTQKAIQSRIGVVLQTPHLFSGTVRENIRYGRLDATDTEIAEAGRVAGADEFIRTLEKGYDTEVGQGGNRLSTGQKQLISLARAVLVQPDILIMDEATSSVDTVTEALIQRGMESLMHGRISFVIAHRLSTIRRADRIVVVESGRICEQGTHAELLRLRGRYHRLYTQQFRMERLREIDLGTARGLLDAGQP